MKKYISRTVVSLLLLIVAAGLGGCTRNNGDIGQWFGSWQIMSIKADGTPVDGYDSQVFIAFQNNIVKLTWVAPDGFDQSYYYAFGTWEQPSDNTLVFDFSHHNDEGTLGFKPFGMTHFPSDAPFPLSISDNTGKKCVLTYIDTASSTTYTYELQKR